MDELPDSSAALGGDWPRFPRQIGAPAPPCWHIKESITLLSGDGNANVIVSSEPLGVEMSTEDYAAAHLELLRTEFPGFRELRCDQVLTFGRDGIRRVFEWHPEDGDPVTQVQLYLVTGGRGFTATATTASQDYDRRRDELAGILGALVIEREEDVNEPLPPPPPGPASAAPPSAAPAPRSDAASAAHPPPAAAAPPAAAREVPRPSPPSPDARTRRRMRRSGGGLFRGRRAQPDAATPPPPPPPATQPKSAPPAPAADCVPSGPVDGERVDCTVYGPDRAGRGSTAFIQAFAHLAEQAGDAEALAQEFDPGTSRRGVRGLATRLRHGDRLSFELSAREVEIADPSAELVWSGQAEAVQFYARVPADFADDAAVFKLVVSHGSVPIGEIRFRVLIQGEGPITSIEGPRGEDATAYRRAFISYASGDREAVLGYTQLLRAVGVDYFQDVVSLEPGERWERRLQESIPQADLFLLFWSSWASASDWVRKEVALALESQETGGEQGSPQIRPVILEGPPPPPPWPEVAHLHFDDPLLYFRENRT